MPVARTTDTTLSLSTAHQNSRGLRPAKPILRKVTLIVQCGLDARERQVVLLILIVDETKGVDLLPQAQCLRGRINRVNPLLDSSESRSKPAHARALSEIEEQLKDWRETQRREVLKRAHPPKERGSSAADDFILYPEKRTAGRRLLAAYPKRRMSPPTIHRWWYRHAEAAGLVGTGMTSGLNMHRARHSFATDLRRVADLGAASQALGHSDLSTTAAIYGHYDLSDLERAMDALARARREGEEPAD